MAAQTGGDDVLEYLQQNPQLAVWLDSLRVFCESSKQWSARREFILRNMPAFPAVQPGTSSRSLDRLLSLSMVWANHVFLGCRCDSQTNIRCTVSGCRDQWVVTIDCKIIIVILYTVYGGDPPGRSCGSVKE